MYDTGHVIQGRKVFSSPLLTVVEKTFTVTRSWKERWFGKTESGRWDPFEKEETVVKHKPLDNLIILQDGSYVGHPVTLAKMFRHIEDLKSNGDVKK